LSNLAARLGTAAVAIPLLLAAFFLGRPWAGFAVIAVGSIVALFEFFALMRARGLQPMRIAGLATLALVFAEVVHAGLLPPLVPAAIVIVVTASLTQASRLLDSVPTAALSLFGGAYLGALGGCMAALLLIGPMHAGPWRIVFLLSVIMTADTAAFFVGKTWGRHKLAPVVSPGKTMEGLGGALVGGIPAALLVRTYGLPELPLWHAIALAVVISGLGVVGDLGESLMKRWGGVKDSGTLFPGHGGMLDRLDSLLFGAPVLYYYFLLVHP
jgi:phosphatidate cytidylyltransferase